MAIARALAKETPIIVADEPTGNLDSQSAADVIRLLAELSKDKLIIIVTHNYDQVEPYVTRKITMHDGRVVEDKTIARPNSLCSEKEVETARADSLQTGGVLRLGLREHLQSSGKIPASAGCVHFPVRRRHRPVHVVYEHERHADRRVQYVLQQHGAEQDHRDPAGPAAFDRIRL